MSHTTPDDAEERLEVYSWISPQDEVFQWNITAMLAAYKDRQPVIFPLSNYPLSEAFFENYGPTLNREYALQEDGNAVDVTHPVLVLIKDGYAPILVDGWHRMVRSDT